MRRTLTRGMEFGASPVAETRRQMIERGSLFGVPAFRWIPARTRVEVRYWRRDPGRCGVLSGGAGYVRMARSALNIDVRPGRAGDLPSIAQIQAASSGSRRSGTYPST